MKHIHDIERKNTRRLQGLCREVAFVVLKENVFYKKSSFYWLKQMYLAYDQYLYKRIVSIAITVFQNKKYMHLNIIKLQRSPFDGNMSRFTQHSTFRVIMAESVENSGSEKMTITVKTPKEKHDIEVGVKSTVREVSLQSTYLVLVSYFRQT